MRPAHTLCVREELALQPGRRAQCRHAFCRVLLGTSAGPRPGAHLCRIPVPVPCHSPSCTVRTSRDGRPAHPPGLRALCHHPHGQNKRREERGGGAHCNCPSPLLLPRGRPPPLPNPPTQQPPPPQPRVSGRAGRAQVPRFPQHPRQHSSSRSPRLFLNSRQSTNIIECDE